MEETKGNPNIAVIMPAYNAENCLETAARSILDQSLKSIRLYIVNDGSTDATAEITERLRTEDGRVIGITVPNGGPAAARNRGLEEALSDTWTDYVMFSDADDAYLPDAFRTAVSAAENRAGQSFGDRAADLVLLGFTILNPDGTKNDYFEPDALYTPDTLGAAFPDLYKANLLNQVWGKLFSAALLRSFRLRFPDYRWGEDRLFVYDCLERASLISVSSACVYLYKIYSSASLISGYYDKKPEVCKLSDGRVRELCTEFRVADDRYCRYMFLKSEFSCLTNLYTPGCSLSGGEKRAYAARILKDGYVQERIRGTGGGLPAKCLAALMSTGNITLNLLAARALTAMSTVAPLLFQKLKHKK